MAQCSIAQLPLYAQPALTFVTLAAKYVGKPVIFGIRPEHLSDQVSDPSHIPVTATVEIWVRNRSFISRLPLGI
jgi:hypothetical protein